MSIDTWELMHSIEKSNIELQLVVQCAPLITGLKVSNLLIIAPEEMMALKRMLEGSRYTMFPLVMTSGRMVVLVYDEVALVKYLKGRRVREFLHKSGYRMENLDAVLRFFRQRYREFVRMEKGFPHEMGVFLGYPIEDVLGFIENKGQDALVSGYWKVYKNASGKKKLFEQFRYAENYLLGLLKDGMSVRDILKGCHALAVMECAS